MVGKSQAVHRHYYQEEDHSRDDEERDHRVYELSDAEDAVVDLEGDAREIRLSAYRGDQRRNEILDQRGDEDSESQTYHHGDRQIHQISPEKKVPELPYHALHPPFFTCTGRLAG